MADMEKISSYPKSEILKTEETGKIHTNNNRDKFNSLESTRNYLKELNFPDNFIDEYSTLLHNRKLYLRSNDYSKFFIMSNFRKENKFIRDHSIKFISVEEFLELLSQSKFFEQFPIILLKTSILIAAIAEETPIKVSDIQTIKNNVLSLNNDPNIIFDEWQKNSGILSEVDNNILRIIEYRNDLNLTKVDIQNNLNTSNYDDYMSNIIEKVNNKALPTNNNDNFLIDKIFLENNEINLKENLANINYSDNNNNNYNNNNYNNYNDNLSNYNSNTNFTNMNFSSLDETDFLIEKYNQKILRERIKVCKSDSKKKTSDDPSVTRKLQIQTKHKKSNNYITDCIYNSQPAAPEQKSIKINQFQKKLQKEKTHQYKHFIAGALSGLISRIITAPLERLKILYQVNYAGKGLKPPNIISGLRQVYLADGFFGLFRGNFVNLIKCTPDSAIKLYVFEKAKFFFSKKEKENKLKLISNNPTLKLLICGGASGICATLCVFPLDVIKTRIAASSNATYSGMFDTTVKLYHEGGLRIFYRGIQASLSSAVPNCGLNLTAYETLKKIFSGSTCVDNAKLLTTPMLMLIGGLSAMFSSTILYPLQTIQSRIIMGTTIYLKKPYQNAYFNDLTNKENKRAGLIKLAKQTFRAEGFKGFYKGYCPGISKIILGNALGFSLYENIKNVLDLI